MGDKKRILIGSFFFRDEGDGCITGKYFNTGMDSPLVETSKFRNRIAHDGNFLGRYNTIWLDTINEPSGLMILDIEPKLPDLYSLVWYNADAPATPVFYGEAMMAGNLLVGCYWSTNVRPDGY